MSGTEFRDEIEAGSKFREELQAPTALGFTLSIFKDGKFRNPVVGRGRYHLIEVSTVSPDVGIWQRIKA